VLAPSFSRLFERVARETYRPIHLTFVTSPNNDDLPKTKTTNQHVCGVHRVKRKVTHESCQCQQLTPLRTCPLHLAR
jgi:hypothetical protein